MPRGSELDPQTRSRICELKQVGGSYTQIQKRFPHIPLGTIQSTVQREKTRENCVSKPLSGAPKKLSEDDIQRIKTRIQEDPHIKYRALLAEVDCKLTKWTIQQLLAAENIRKWPQRGEKQMTKKR